MPYHLNWYDETQTILHVTAEGSVTWDEYLEVYDRARNIVLAGTHRIDIIADPDSRMPAGNPLPRFRQLISSWAGVEHFGLLVVVRHRHLSGFIQSTAKIAGMLMNAPVAERVLFVSSIEQALEKIYSARGERTPQND